MASNLVILQSRKIIRFLVNNIELYSYLATMYYFDKLATHLKIDLQNKYFFILKYYMLKLKIF